MTAGAGAAPVADPGSRPAGGEAPAREGGRGPAPWQRALVALGAALAVFLLGAAAGLLLGLPGAAPPPPAADSVDVGFAQDMTVHHEQAVQMASWARDHSTDPVIRQLAYDIESTQTAEIGRMQGWLSLWNRAPLPPGGHMAWMDAASGHDHGPADAATGAVATMPGMASSAELAALRAATGRELDVLFLQLMLRHHRGGAPMLQYGAEHASVPQVRNLAAKMLTAQTNENAYLLDLLNERGGTPLPS